LAGIKKRYTFAPLSAPEKGVGGMRKRDHIAIYEDVL
jgi:hypothetical protein